MRSLKHAGVVASSAAAVKLVRGPRCCFCSSSAVPVFDSVHVQKPATDYRRYKTAVLPNNLRVMVVSDAKCDRAAAALSVKVGSIFDPKDIPGLAHFCEHMLFLGTKKYPGEDEYNEYLNKNGGMSNAYTAETVTNYFFSVKPDALNGALDRFAQFFIEPLFTETATARELEAVDSEHSKNLQQDGWRLSQLLRSAVNPEHPLHHFMTGNSRTLRDTPKDCGVDVRASLLDFHARYYSANLMRLVIVGPEEPEELLAMASTHFSPIVDTSASVPEDKDIGGNVDAFPLERLSREVRVVPVNDVRRVEFQFVLPGQRQFWKSKPTNYLAHLLGHEGSGSLLAALKQRSLATELSAGGSLDEAGVHIFSVTVMLTEKGESDIAAVGDLLFSYIDLLKETGPQEWVWKELKRVSDLSFQFRSLSDSMSTASGLAHALQVHDPEVALSASACVWEYLPAQIQELTGMLTCNRLRLVLGSQIYEPVCDQEEPWYGTRYSDKSLDGALKASWEAPKRIADLSLPTQNPFVPEDLALRASSESPHPPKPHLLDLDIKAAKFATAYFRKDEDFELPKAACSFQLYCPFASQSVENRIKTQLWCLAVTEELNEFAYDAHQAGLSYSLQATPMGMILGFGGYNDKLPELVSAVAKKMAALVEVPEQTFSITHTVLERNLFNATVRSAPYTQGFMHEACLLGQPAHSPQERLTAVRHLGSQGCSALSGVARELLGSCHIECLLQGNLMPEEAKELVSCLVHPLEIAHELHEVPLAGTAQLPLGWTLLERKGTNPDERNGAVVVHLQVDPFSLRSECLVSLASQVLSQRFFNDLRTKEQLGYIVSASSHSDQHGFVGLRFIVQSEKPMQEVFTKVRDWVGCAWQHLADGLTEAEFAEYRAALISRLRERPKSLGEEFGANWGAVASRSFDFNRREQQVHCLEGLRFSDFQSFARDKLATPPAVCTLVRASHDDSCIALPAEEAPTKRWSPNEVEEFRRDATWKFWPVGIGKTAAGRSRL